jgi:uncharacterized membrane protein
MSNNERQIVENIRKGYEKKEVTKLDELKELDRRTKRPAEVFAYIFGSIGALVLGSGMCLAMPEVIEGYMALGIGVGLIGIAMVSVNYFIYKAHLAARRRKASSEIFRLSNEILGNA